MTDKHLPVIGTTAASTDFVSATVVMPHGLGELHIDGNQKISGWDPKPNAFSLEAQAVADREQLVQYGGSISDIVRTECPGSTDTCRASCYVDGLNKHQSAIYDLYRANSRTIRAILAAGGGRMLDCADELADWIHRNCYDIGFRWHVSGDVFNAKYARWIAEVCQEAPLVQFWIYTRSFDFVVDLMPVSTTRGGNLSINLSADRDNYQQARETATHHGLRICYMVVGQDDQNVHDLAAGSVIFPDYPLRPKGLADPTEHPWWKSLSIESRKQVCPVDAFGKSPSVRCGVCTKCMK